MLKRKATSIRTIASLTLQVVLPVILAIFILDHFKEGTRKATDIGLGKGTSTFLPYLGKYPLHLYNPVAAESMKEGWEIRGKKDLLLWFGNSQLHGINKYVTGQKNCIAFLFDKLQAENKEVLGISYPNANLQEMLASVIYFSKLFHPQKILLPVFFDDMREDGIRDILKYKPLIDSIKKSSAYFSNVSSLNNLMLVPANPEGGANNSDFNGIRETLQDKSERYLDSVLEKNWGIWSKRPDMRAAIFTDIYSARNTMMGINAATVRKMIPGRYNDNFAAFKDIVAFCDQNKIPLLIYIPPIRQDASSPYERAAYDSFKVSVEKVCKIGNASFINLEKLIPNIYWSFVTQDNFFDQNKAIDYMHFQQMGHKIIADTIFTILKENSNR